jgi:2-methylisocitrate lyase-like PEP mutase family enzyme
MATPEEGRSMNRTEKVTAFRALHAAPGAFVIGNPWDAGSARVLASLGYRALATSSGAMAGTFGRRDGRVTRDEALAHARQIVQATDLPVSADLEKCFADAPKEAAETIRLAAEAGLAGGSIEDATGRKDPPLFDFASAVERVGAAAEVSGSAGFVLTARTELLLRGMTDLEEVIRRLQAYEKAGADVLMAPGLPDLEAVRAVCKALKKPVNFMAGIQGKSFTVAELQAAGVKRISVAASFYRAAMTGLQESAREVMARGTFEYLDRSMTTPELNNYFKD